MSLHARLADYIATRLATLEVAGYAVATVSEDEIACVAGGARREGAATPVTVATPFHICSCSKAFTALACAQLVERGVTSWDTPAAALVPEFELADSEVTRRYTLRDLAGMRIGLERDGIAEWGFHPDAPVERRLARARAMRLAAPFRDRFCYSNLSYIALACAVARLTGKSFEECVRQLVFEPLGLRDAALTADQHAALPHLPAQQGRMVPVPELTGANSQGSARVHLSARDAAQWLQFNLSLCGERNRPAIEALFSPQSEIRPQPPRVRGLPALQAYGFGWQLAQLNDAPLFQHGGGGRGWRAMTMLLPAQRRAVMVMLAHEGVAAEGLALELLELLDGRVPSDAVTLLAARADEEARVHNEALHLTRAREPAPLDDLLPGHYGNDVTGRVELSTTNDARLHFAAADAPAFDAILAPRRDGVLTFELENPAMRTMPRDPPFEARLVAAGGALALETTYFGTLAKLK